MSIDTDCPLFYFSGTGGSLATARDIAMALPDYKPIPIAAHSGSYTVMSDTVGFVFPLYFSGLPHIAAEFIKRLEFTKPCYIFAVMPCGHPITGYSLKQLSGLLKSKKQQLSSGFYLKMIDNYLPIYDVPSKNKLDKIYKNYDAGLEKITSHIRARDHVIAPSLGGILYLGYPRNIETVGLKDEHFTVDEKCNGCGQCQRVCPVNNIVMTDLKPVWQHKCEFCHACIHLCPQHAIQWKNVTQKKGRYHFKGVSAADISKQKQPIE